MPDSVLRTKLHRPETVGELVCRPRLHALLDAGLPGPLTLICAPAGYGKTTLLSQWLESRSEKSAWVSLDERDSDARAFLQYLVAAVRTAYPEACADTYDLLAVPNPVPVSVLLRSLTNELDALEQRLILVLDDYHDLRLPEAHELINELLRHPPSALHLVISARRDPPLNLVALRAQNRLTELRMADLAFTATETAQFLEQVLGGAPGDAAIANVQRQFEGWAVGLRLAALAACSRENTNSFMAQLHGDLSDVRDYLLTEVVAGQPANAQTWLRKLSVPKRFNAALCEHLCAEEANEELGFDGHTFLRGLQRAGLFLIALDRSGEWYRYHALFRGLLRRQLERSEGPEGVAALDRRASAWFAESGLVDEAIQHALAAGDQATAAGLVEQNRYKVLQNGRWHDLERWLNRLPRELIDARPELLMANAWVRRSHYDHAAIPPLVAAVETTRGTRKPSPIIEGELQFFKGHTEYYKVEDTRSPALLEQARASTLRNFAAAHGIVEVHHAMAVQKAGHKQRAVRQLRTALQASDSPPVTTSLNLRIGLALVHLIELDLAESLREAARIRAIAHDAVDARLEGWGFYLTASVHFLRNELHEAPQLLESNIGRPFALYQRLALDSFAVRALCFQGCGDVERARQTHALMEAFASESGNPTFVTVAAACEARLALAQGDAARAERCLEHADVRNDGSLMLFWVESPRLTECRIRLARGTRAAGESVLRTLRDYERENRTAHNRLRLLDILVLQASAHCLSGRKDEAFDALREAVAIAERGGVVYPFVEAGPPIVALLRRLGRDAGDSRFISRLVAACDRRAAAEPREGGVLASRTMPAAALFGLTNREEEVLGLLVQRLEAKEIAARLFVAPSTVNFHLKNIYAKMRVGCRRDAIAKVRARGAGARSQVT